MISGEGKSARRQQVRAASRSNHPPEGKVLGVSVEAVRATRLREGGGFAVQVSAAIWLEFTEGVFVALASPRPR